MELTEKRLAQIEQQAKEYRIVGVSVADVLAIVSEVRRLRAKVAVLEAGEAVMETITQKVGEAVIVEEKPDLAGEIKVGERFIWEPRSSAYERIIVTQVRACSDGETVIESVNERGERHWNDEARFREACIRAVR
jgi:hypothetical protein